MDIYSTLGYIFSPKPEKILNQCRYCGTYHANKSDFCCPECSDKYDWEYQQEFYTNQLKREQETEQL